MHQTSGKWQLGLALTLTTCVWWGILPITLAGVMHKMDPVTLTFYRFLIAVLILLPYLAARGQLSGLKILGHHGIAGMVLLGGVMLALNYGFYIFSLQRTSPSGAQVLIQMAPMLFLLSGIFIFGEKFSRAQWGGFFTFVLGLGLFFHLRLTDMLQGLDEYGFGMLLMVFASIFWAAYAIAQKKLVQVMSSVLLMLLINAIGALVFLPFSQPLVAFELNAFEAFLLLLCGLNTVIGYGCFSEALNHWEASRISATLSIVPLLTLVFVELTLASELIALAPEPLDAVVISGALLVVAGAFVASLKRNEDADASAAA